MKLKFFLFLLVSLPFSETALFAQDFGLQLYSLRNQFKNDIEKSLKTIADWGINTVEGGDTYGMEEAEFRSLLAKYELNPISIGADYEELRKNPEAVAEKA
ncbi:MAG: sugar phosphate isomerase/epimerase, partial [Bacteroidia bacterium]|nr:sugar phosphate isomerase/epimerase [Bacteroidia bacterium]